MKIWGKYIVFIFLASLIIDAESSSTRRLSRNKRSIGQFGDMIRLYVQREALHYNNYGNHCGFQGGDFPIVDEVDRCCYVHDRCYIAADADPCASSWLGASFIRYTWSFDGQAVTCGEEDDACRRAACLCDKAAVECFARHPWNPANKKSSIWDILA
ncbi:basic phospholipase A2 acanthin-1-like [Palaemon carinicauda]|uniref:basic phospholipase A2 acanthin-1-like n=1 Tax=Palaemon carinicauda TaxID=392227 RepID=UPI0035B5F0AA